MGIEVTGRRGRRRRKLLDDLKERRGYSQLKEEALDLTMWRALFGRCFGPVVKQTTKWVKDLMLTAFNWTEVSGSQLTANSNSGYRSAACCYAKRCVEETLIFAGDISFSLQPKHKQTHTESV